MIETELPSVPVEESRSTRARRFTLSSILRFASAGVQMWGGVAGAESALIVEAAEEFTDGLTFAAVAVESRTERRGLVRKVRNAAITLAVGAAAVATYGTISEIIGDGGSLMSPVDGIDWASSQNIAAVLALAFSSIVFFINRHGRKSSKVSDKFAYRDSIRDFIIPASILGLAVVQAPHFVEYIFELGGATYGWYNVNRLYRGWRS